MEKTEKRVKKSFKEVMLTNVAAVYAWLAIGGLSAAALATLIVLILKA